MAVSKKIKKNYNKKRAIDSLKFLENPYDFSFLKNDFHKIYLKPTFTNIIISITDANNKVLACHSSGSSGVVGTSRRKKAPQAVASILKKLHTVFLKHNIRAVEIIITNRASSALYSLVRELSYYGVFIATIRRRLRIAHNGVRRRKMPRK